MEEALPFDIKSLVNTQMAAYVERLRSRGATFDEATASSQRASAEMFRRSQSLISRCAFHVASMVDAGSDGALISGYANAAFAIAGVELADEMFQSLIAERN